MSQDITLYEAAKTGNLAVLEKLIQAGVNLDKPNQDGDSAIFIAFYYQNIDFAKRLIEAGVNTNVKDSENETLLHWASLDHTGALCKLLLEKGLDHGLNSLSRLNETPLTYAIESGNYVVVKLLLKAGANPFHPSTVPISILEKGFQVAVALYEAGVPVSEEMYANTSQRNKEAINSFLESQKLKSALAETDPLVSTDIDAGLNL